MLVWDMKNEDGPEMKRKSYMPEEKIRILHFAIQRVSSAGWSDCAFLSLGMDRIEFIIYDQ